MSNYAVSVSMVKSTPTQHLSTHVLCVCYGVSEDEAKGKAVADALELKPGFCVAGVACLEIREENE